MQAHRAAGTRPAIALGALAMAATLSVTSAASATTLSYSCANPEVTRRLDSARLTDSADMFLDRLGKAVSAGECVLTQARIARRSRVVMRTDTRREVETRFPWWLFRPLR